ncbi:MAG: motility associated factor glycosyltransferase family protein [Planctomycetes bacterium]|nr:motility associated factor glycosyltransferase family protein [Planctomycetota bacterium]MBI3835542.1 motility associated factor glycosyltransferase family protein [Planctomycetota bacterium]
MNQALTNLQAPPNANEVFLRNMRLLWRFDADLALRVDAIHDHERIPLERTRSGEWTARASTNGGAGFYLHSRHDPLAEAKTWADAVPIEDKFCIVVSGLGLGYHVQALFKRLRGDAIILCIEPNLAMISTALACNDFSDMLASKRFLLLNDDDKARLHAKLQPLSSLIMLGAQFAPYAPARRLNESRHAQIQNTIAEYVAFTRMSLLTLVGNARITCKNIAMNLGTYVTTPPIDSLKDRFAGRPGIVISAGPSLGRNIDQLAELKGRAVLCAVQTAIGPLMHKGIVPDFITSLDFHEMSRRFFEGVGDLRGAHLVAEPKATWHVIDEYPGPVSLLDNAWARLVLGEELGARAGLPAGATVAHLAFYLAIHLGCDPIIFVGQDLAYTGHVFYVPGVEIHQTWRGEINRFNTMEQKEWDRIVRNRPILRKVRGNDESELYTDDLLFTYLEQFEKDIASTPRRIINATEGGARIRGTESMSLRAAAEKYCTSTIPQCEPRTLVRADGDRKDSLCAPQNEPRTSVRATHQSPERERREECEATSRQATGETSRETLPPPLPRGDRGGLVGERTNSLYAEDPRVHLDAPQNRVPQPLGWGTDETQASAHTDDKLVGTAHPTNSGFDFSTFRRFDVSLRRASDEVRKRLDEIAEAQRVCDELLVLLAELERLTDDPPRFNRRLVRVDELRAKIHADTRAYQIINMATQLAELRRFSADRRIEASEELSDSDRAKRQIARDIDFITAVRDGAKDVTGILHEAMERMSDAVRSK